MFACIAATRTPGDVWVAHTEYTISKKTIAGETNTIWDCRYASSIPKKRKLFEFGYVGGIAGFESYKNLC